MRVKLPATLSVSQKSELGLITQISNPSTELNCKAVPFTLEKTSGYLLQSEDHRDLAYVVSPRLKMDGLATSIPVLAAKFESINVPYLDLSDGQWLPSGASFALANVDYSKAAHSARASWLHAFRFAAEDVENSVIGLRKPQLGALHAIHAHWSVSDETATVVMPTGTGKTETMLSVLTSCMCDRILVVVPSDALRAQLAEKFETLGMLKMPNNRILADTALRPVVGRLSSKPKSLEEMDAFFSRCNVIVTTSHLLSGLNDVLQTRVAHWCSHLFIDEAHHSEAQTWRHFRERFSARRVLQFTATPFREDGQKIDGKLIYNYPLRAAQEEGYFKPIKFRPVSEFSKKNGDIEIAKSALSALDEDSTGKHIVMARVASKARADEVFKLYQEHGANRYEAVVIHSGMKASQVRSEKQKLFDGSARIVVCVDMLGEGFDLPELKIAAFHDIRKSLAVTLQLAGRFTRTRADLGDALFIANIALIEVRDELQQLYAREPDWNLLLPELSGAAIGQEIVSQEFFKGFTRFVDEVPMKDLRPAASMVVYKTDCHNWNPKNFKTGFRSGSSRDKLFHAINENEKTLVVLAATEGTVRWSDVESIRETNWELLIVIWDIARELLYIHGSGINGEYKDLAKAICGKNVKLVVAPEVFRSFHGVKRLVMSNVGLEEHLGRQVRYTGRMGSDVEARIGQDVRRSAKRAVLAGSGYEDKVKVSVGAAKRGRVWSSLRLRIDTFSRWARELGRKIADDTIDTDAILEGTLKPRQIGTTPELPAIAAEWPREIWERPLDVSVIGITKLNTTTATFVDIEVAPRGDGEPITLRIFSDDWESFYRLELSGKDDECEFKFVHVEGAKSFITPGPRSDSIFMEEFLTENPPTIWFANGASLEGTEFTELPSASLLPYRRDLLKVIDWDGVDVTAESQGLEKKTNTIQYKIIQMLQADATYRIIFDDDGSGECADVVGIRVVEEDVRTYIEVELYHLKYTGKDLGNRVDDLYVVCGQAQRSATWMASHARRTDLFVNLLRRNQLRIDAGKASRFERGTAQELLDIKNMSRRYDMRLKVFVVQPGLSQSEASDSQLRLLAVTERYLSDTYGIEFVAVGRA